jgi:DNA-binding transcriptional LysR family regulator
MLGVEHATVARRLRQLEEAMGLKLFERLQGGWRLTPEAASLLPHAVALEAAVFALSRAASEHKTIVAPVRISTTPLLLRHGVLPAMAKLSARHPESQLELVGEVRMVDLLRGDADLALRFGEPRVKDLISRPVGRVHYALYCANEAVPAADCARFIGFSDDPGVSALRGWVDRYAESRVIATRTNDVDAAAALARQGWGVALLPRFLGDSDPGLAAWQPDAAPPSRTVYLTMHPAVRGSPRIRPVSDCLVEHLSSWLDGMPGA